MTKRARLPSDRVAPQFPTPRASSVRVRPSTLSLEKSEPGGPLRAGSTPLEARGAGTTDCDARTQRRSRRRAATIALVNRKKTPIALARGQPARAAERGTRARASRQGDWSRRARGRATETRPRPPSGSGTRRLFRLSRRRGGRASRTASPFVAPLSPDTELRQAATVPSRPAPARARGFVAAPRDQPGKPVFPCVGIARATIASRRGDHFGRSGRAEV